MRLHREPGPEGYLQIGRGPWITIWRGGFTANLRGKRLLCLRPPWNAPLFSERYGVGVRPIFRLLGWRLFVRDRA